MRDKVVGVLLATAVSLPVFAAQTQKEVFRSNFVDIKTVVPTVQVDMRYASDFNFTGAPLPGYEQAKCLLTKKAAEALKKVQATVNRQGYSLLLWDCYRPKSASEAMVKWAEDGKRSPQEEMFFPGFRKAELLSNGYIDRNSSHSRGSTVDITLMRLDSPTHKKEKPDNPQEHYTGIQMGTPFDYFRPRSFTASPRITPEQQRNRMILVKAMEENGFKNFPAEWWHYILKDEPFPNTSFNLPVKWPVK